MDNYKKYLNTFLSWQTEIHPEFLFFRPRKDYKKLKIVRKFRKNYDSSFRMRSYITHF